MDTPRTPRRHFRRILIGLVPAMLAALLITSPIGAPANADDNPATQDLAMQCTQLPALTPDNVLQAGIQGVVAEERVTFSNEVTFEAGDIYQDILQRPDGSVYYASRIELVALDPGLVLDPASVAFTIDGVAQPFLAQPAPAMPDPTMFVLETEFTATGTLYRLLFPGDEAQMLADQTGFGALSYQVLNPTEVFAVSFDATVPVGAPQATIYEASECFASVSTGPSNRDTNRQTTAVIVVEPQLNLTKTTALDNSYPAGSVVEFEIIAEVPLIDPTTQLNAVAAAQDVTIVDTPDPDLIPIDASGNPVADGGTTAGGGIWDATAGKITYALGTIAPDSFVAITEQFRIAGTAGTAAELTNTVCANFTALGPDDPNRLDSDCAEALVTVSSESPSLTKRALRIPDAVDLERYGTGLPFWYEVVVTLPGNSNYENFTILDNLPDGIQFNSYVSAVCAPANCPPSIATLSPTVFPGGNGTGIGWYPNSIPFDAATRTITLRYEVEMAPTYASGDPVEFFDEFINDVSINWNTVDRLGAVAPVTASPPPFDGEVSTSDVVIHDRPVLDVDKTVTTTDGVFADTNRGAWDFEIGDIAVYSIEISNVGSSDAYNVQYDDAPIGLDIDLASVTIDGVACGAACSLVGPDLQTVIPGPIAPGQTVTVSYEATPNQNGDLDNTVELPVYEDVFASPYVETPTDTVGLNIPDPVLALAKTEVSDVAQTANTVGTRFPFTFTVTNVSSTTAYTPIVTDTPPAGLCNYAGGLDAPGVATETAPGVWELDSPLAPGASVTFTAMIEVCGDVDPGAYVNDATLTWTDLVDGVDEAGNAYTTDDDAPLELVGPTFEITKGPPVDGGATLAWSADLDDPEDGLQADELNGGVWSITVANTGPAPIGGLNVVDPMPQPFEYLPGTATIVWLNPSTPDTFTDNSDDVANPGVWPGYSTEVDLVLGQLLPGQEVRIDIPFIHSGEDPDDGQLTRLNTVEVRNDNLVFDPALHSAEGEYTLIPIETGPSVSKTVSAASDTPGIGVESEPGAPGQQFDFAIEVTLPTKATTSLHDVWIQDVLPDGLVPVNLPVAGTVPASPTTGWTVTCVSNCGTGASGGGAFIGQQANSDGTTELAWWFDEVAPDATEADIVYVITFRAEVETAFQDGTEIIDGFDEPLINVAKPIFNRDTALPGGTGDQVAAIPGAVPVTSDYERVYPLDPAEVDVVTPRLDIDKNIYNADGDEVEEITAGQQFSYEVIVTNGGTGPAFDIDINDTLGTPEGWTGPNFMTWDPATIAATPAGVTCAVYSPSPPDPIQNLGCEYPGPLAPGASIVITYDATTVPADDFYAQTSTNNFDPMIIRNQASAPEYWEAAGEGGNQYSTGEAVTRVFAYTPVPEIDATCVGGAEVLPNAPVGSTVQFYAVFGNGDRSDVNGNPDGDQTMTPFPTEDLDGDGFPDAGIGFNPEVRITLQDKFTYVGTTATGPGAGDPTYSTYSNFPPPDQIVDEEIPNTYTLVWNTSLQDIPHSPNHASEGNFLPHNGTAPPTNGDFLPHYAFLIDVVKTENGGGSIWFELSLEDAAGNTDRGNGVGEPFSFTEKDRHGCPGGPPPRVWKFPDDTDGVTLAPGQVDEFVIYIQQPNDELVPSVFTDLLPNGLTYRGDLPIGDPDYAVATMDTIPATWPAGSTLEDYFTSSTTSAAGDTTLIWNPPPLPKGLFNDPDAGGADTRFVIRIPVIANDVPAFPNEFVVNNFEWNADGSTRKDSGAMLTESAGNPSIDKRVDSSAGLYGEVFRYTVDVTIPGGYAGTDVLIYDQINRGFNWDAAPYLLQEGATNWHTGAFVFPFARTAPAPPAPPAPEYRWAHWLYTPAEFELSDYVSQTCLSGCSGPDAIDLVPLPPAQLDETLTLPLTTADQYSRDDNGAIGWYLGDIEAHTGGQDRVVRLVYEVEAPTLLEQRQRVFEQQPSNFPGGATDPGFDVRDSYWFEELSQVVHPNLVQFRQFANDNGVVGSWEGGGDDEWETGSNAWHDELNQSSVLASADEAVTVSYPIIDMDKECGAIGISDLTDATGPSVTPAGTPNVECEVIVTNLSPVEGFDIQVTDTPLSDCVMAAVLYRGDVTYIGNMNSSNPWGVERSANGTGFTDPSDPGVVTYPCEVQSLLTIPTVGIATATAGDFPLTWDLQLGPNATETLTYQFYLDGWSDQLYSSRFANNGSWDAQGQWINRAVLGQWSAEPDGPLIGEEVVVQDQVGFQDSQIIANKFPYPYQRDVCADAAPFIQWNQAPQSNSTNLWPWRHHPNGDQYNPANTAHAAGFGNPLNSDYWTEGNDYCADPLIPPDREVRAFSWPGVLRHIPLGGYNFSTAAGWGNYGDAYVLGTTNQGWTNRPLDDPNNWSPQYNAQPTVPYRWSIDIRIDGLTHISDLDIVDTLPYGWEYIPGTAKIVDGVWILGDAVGGAFDSSEGKSVGYGEIPIPDPVRGNIGGGACHDDNNYHSGGETLTWNFERSGGADGDAPWLYQYVDAREWTSYKGAQWPGFEAGTTGWTDKATWVRIHFDALPTMAVFDCDPDPTSSERFMMENNLRVDAVRDNAISGQGITLGDTFDMLVPVANPVTFEKLPDDDFVSDDTTAFFTIEFTNDLAVPVEDLLITDDLTASLPPLAGGGYACGTATATRAGLPEILNETVCTTPLSQSTHLEWVIPVIAPGETLLITVPIIVPMEETNGLQWNNTSATMVKEFFDSPFEDDGRITVLNPSPAPTPSKVASPNPATINDVVTYEVSWTANPLQVFMDLAYIDMVPDGLTFDSFVGITCSGGCPNSYTPADVITLPQVANADGTTTLMWWFGDMPGSNQPHTWTMTYTVRVDDTYNDGTLVVDEDALDNTVTGYASHENLIDGDPAVILDPSAWAASEHPPSDPGVATLDIEEPELAIRKTATPSSTPADGSSTIVYTVEIENIGGMDAQNVTVSDTPNLALENIVMDPTTYPNSFVTQGWTPLVPEVSWFITTIAQGDTATFTYTADVVDTFLADGNWFAENDASIDSFYARPGADPAPGDRSYVGPEATSEVPLVAPQLEIEKTVTDCAENFAFTEIGQPVTWCLTVSNVGAAVAYNVAVGDQLPYNWTYEANSTTGTGWTVAEPTVSLVNGTDFVEWTIGDLQAGDTAVIQFQATPQPGAPEVVTNWAAAEMTDVDGNSLPPTVTVARDRDPATASIGLYGLEIAKVPDQQQWPYIPAGGTFTWDLEVENPSDITTNTNLTVIDYLPAPLLYSSWSSTDPRVSLVAAGAPGSGPGGTTPVTWTITDLGPLETIIIEIEAAATGGEVPNQWYVNDVQVTSDQISDEVVNQAKVWFYEPASLGDYVWLDTNVDGIQDPAEVGVNGVIVTLLDGNGDPLYRDPTTGLIYTTAQWNALTPAQQAAAPVMTMTTSNDPASGAPGWYEFDGLPAGSYQVLFDPAPTGLFLTLDEQGPNDATDSDANRFVGTSHVVTLLPGDHDPTIDAGLITPEQYDDTIASIDIEKFTNGIQADVEPGPALVPGDPVTWTYQVTNDGWTSLASVRVGDTVEGAVNCDIDGDGTYDGTDTIPLLLPGETRVCFITGVVDADGSGLGTGPYENFGRTEGTPVVPDFETCGCDPDDPTTWPTDPADNEPAESAVDGGPLGDVRDNDPSHYYSASPSIDIEKSTNAVDADLPTGPAIPTGGAVTWTYEVENTGNTALVDVTVTDSQGEVVACDVDNDGIFEGSNIKPLLNPGDTVTCQATGTALPGPYDNTGLVTGEPVLPNPETCGCDLDDPDSWPDDENLFDETDLDDVDADDPSHYFGITPAIDIEKDTNGNDADLTPGPAIPTGDTVTWTYVVTNTGDTALFDATVTDDQGVTVSCDVDDDGVFESTNVIPFMLPDAEVTCQGTAPAVAGQYTNNATVEGQPALPDPATCDCVLSDPDSWPNDGDEFDVAVDGSGVAVDAVEDDDPSHYFGAEPSVDVEKSTNTVDADLTPGPAITPPGVVTWTYVVTNDGNTALDNVGIVDSDGAAIACDLDGDGVFEAGATIGLLLPGASVTCEATGTAVAGQYENTVDVTGDPVLPNPETCGCDPFDPGDWPEDPALFDPAVDEEGDPLPAEEDDDPSHYYGALPAIDIEKATNGNDADLTPGPAIAPGGAVTWTYVVENTGNTALANSTITDSDGVTVSCDLDDDGVFEGSNVIPHLNPGDTVTCEATGLAVAGQYENIADVSGDPVLPNPDTCGCDPFAPDDWPDTSSGFSPAVDQTGTPLPAVDDDDPSHYYGSEPGINVEKSTVNYQADNVSGPGIAVGDPVTWTYLVINDGNTALDNVEITDSDGVTISCDLEGDGVFEAGSTIGFLLPDDSVNCQATGTSIAGQYENIADVTGDPLLPNPETCGCDPFDPNTWPDDPSVFDEALDEDGNPVDPVIDDDPSHYYGTQGGVDLEKSTNDVDADQSPGPAVDPGAPITWTYTVTNTSNFALTNLEVTDFEGVTVTCPDGGNVIFLLLPGGTTECTGTGTAIDGQYTNSALVEGDPSLPDPDLCGCDPFDPDTWPEGPPEIFNPIIDPDTGEPTEPADDVDLSHYYGATPGIDIEKSTNGHDADAVTGPAIPVGDTVTWTYVVENTGNTALANVAVTDSDGAGVACDLDDDGVFESGSTIGHLNPGDTVTCEATAASISGQYENIADVTGDPILPDPETCGCDPFDPDTWPEDSDLFDPAVDEDGTPLPAETDDDPSHYFGSDPGIDIEKSTNGNDADVTPGPAIATGDAVTWTYVVENTGNTALANAVVTDSDGVTVACDLDGDGVFESGNTIPLLGVGESVTCEATGTSVPGQYENIADVDGQPVLPDPETCGCDLTDPDSWPTDGDYEPILDEDGEELPNVDDDDPSHYYGAEPSLDVEKSTNGIDADVNPGPAIVPGDPVTWTYVVINDGNTALANVGLTDSDGAAVACDLDGDGVFESGSAIGHLNPGDSVTCEATGVATSGQYQNIADVTGDPVLPNPETCGCDPFDPETWPEDPEVFDPAVDEDGTPLPAEIDDDPSHYFGSEPGVDIEKSTNGNDADVTPGPAIATGDAVTWTYVVENTGNTALANATITDSDGVTISCDLDGDGVFESGSTIPLMGVGESVTCEATGTSVPGQYENIADVDGQPVLPDPETCGCDFTDPGSWPTVGDYEPILDEDGEELPNVDDDDPSHYYGAEPSLDVEKSTNGTQADSAPGQGVAVGDPVTWTYVVTNDGNTALANVAIADSDGVTIACDLDDDPTDFESGSAIGHLNPGDSVTCEATGVATSGQYQNVADVAGDPVLPNPETCGCDPFDPETWPEDPEVFDPAVDESGDPLPPETDDDTSHYYGTTGGVDIEKSTNTNDADTTPGPAITPGGSVTWTYVVTNTSVSALANLTVTDSQGVSVDCGDGTPVIALLSVGGQHTCTGSGTAIAGQYENGATVVGDPVLPDEDTCDCDLDDPSTWPSDPDVYVPVIDDETGEPAAPVDDVDLSHYYGAEPGIDVEKSTNGVDADVPPGPALSPGEPVTWTYLVTNTGNTALADITVTDSQGVAVDCGTGSNEIAFLNPGDSVSCTGSGVAIAGQYSNTADVSGTPLLPDPDLCGCDPFDPSSWPDDPSVFSTAVDENGSPIADPTASDDSHYFAGDGSLDIEKATQLQDADDDYGPVLPVGSTVTWTYVITNNSNVAMVQATVGDDDARIAIDCGDGTPVIPLLLPGQSHTCEGTGTATSGYYRNIGTVSGLPSAPNPETCDCDPADPTTWPEDPELFEIFTLPSGVFVEPSVDADPSNFWGGVPAVDIEKSTNGVDADTPVEGQGLFVGSEAVFEYVVTNSGDTALVALTVGDDQGVAVDCGDGTATIAFLAPSQSVTCTGSATVVEGDYVNVGDVSGTPAFPDPATCGCDLDDPSSWPTDPGGYIVPNDPATGEPIAPVGDADPSHHVGYTTRPPLASSPPDAPQPGPGSASAPPAAEPEPESEDVPGALALTGSNSRVLVLVGLVAIVTGAAFVLVGKRRREDDEDHEDPDSRNQEDAS